MKKNRLIREMGNCGNLDKLKRITEALNIAISHKVTVMLLLDPLVYGGQFTVIDTVESYDFNKTDIIINGAHYPWWDITKLSLVF